ncbi:glycosyltransferase family 4 protein [Patescibacteria group bacterium]|nr:glycosyltransferase family 4 protein [Patescibacteria group bacterium]
MKDRKPLRIAVIAPPWLPVPPHGYGGIELVVHALTEELVLAGHEVTLFASGDSTTCAKLVSPYPKALRNRGVPWTNCTFSLVHIHEALKHQEEFDIIHSHIDSLDVFFAKQVSVPFVSTVHTLLHKRYPEDLRTEAYRHFPNHKVVTISHDQKNKATVALDYIDTVYNGIPLKEYTYSNTPDDYFAWLGRVIEYKGVLGAIAAAKKGRAHLNLAGVIEKPEESFFEKRVKPDLDDRITYIGEVSGKTKNSFLKNAKALLCPIEWEEPFGLTLIEAMACGTPVIAFNRGAIPEIIAHGKTGYIVENVDEMVEAMGKVDAISREECRKHVEEKFSSKKMASAYENVYYSLVK